MTMRSSKGSVEVAKDLLRRLNELKSKRTTFDTIYDDVAEHVCHFYKGFSSKPDHAKRQNASIVDSTAKRAAATFSAGMLSGLSSPSARWFSLSTGDKDLDAFPRARSWLQIVEDDYYDTFYRAQYYPQQHLAYYQTGLFGWQCMYLDETPAMGIRFNARPLHEVYLDENFQGMVDTVFRAFSLTARQAAQKWGEDALSEKTRSLLQSDTDKAKDMQLGFLHAVMPREDVDKSALDHRSKPYASYYVEMNAEKGHVVAESGYESMPYIVSRYVRLPGTPYSYSPGTEALADVQMINEMKRLILEAGQLAVAPPYLLPDDGFLGRFSYEPRALNYYQKGQNVGVGDFQPMPVGGDPRFGFELLMETRRDINEAFFVDLFQVIKNRTQEGTTPTAREVAELAGEKMFLLAPMIVSQQVENFDALFDRLFHLKKRRGELPPIPQELEGKELRAEFVSPLALAQREHITQAIMQTYMQTASIAEVQPDVWDVFNHEENVRRIARQRGIPQAGLHTREEVAAMRQARAQAQQQQAQARAMGAAVEKAVDEYGPLSKAPEEGSPAGELVRALTEGEE